MFGFFHVFFMPHSHHFCYSVILLSDYHFDHRRVHAHHHSVPANFDALDTDAQTRELLRGAYDNDIRFGTHCIDILIRRGSVFVLQVYMLVLAV